MVAYSQKFSSDSLTVATYAQQEEWNTRCLRVQYRFPVERPFSFTATVTFGSRTYKCSYFKMNRHLTAYFGKIYILVRIGVGGSQNRDVPPNRSAPLRLDCIGSPVRPASMLPVSKSDGQQPDHYQKAYMDPFGSVQYCTMHCFTPTFSIPVHCKIPSSIP